LRKRQARELIKIDVNKTARIFEFFQQQGWLRWPGTQVQQHLDKTAKEKVLGVPNGVVKENGGASGAASNAGEEE